MKKFAVLMILVMGILVWGFADVGWGAISQYLDFQGKITGGTIPPDGTTSMPMTFRIFDMASGGTQIGSDITLPAVTIEKGIFSVQIPIATTIPFDSEYWLEIQAAASIIGRQRLTTAPYAFTAKNLKGGKVDASGGSDIAVFAASTSGYGVHGQSDTIDGVHGVGVRGGVLGYSTSGYGVKGESASGYGVHAKANTNIGIFAESTSGYGVHGQSDTIDGVHGVGVRGGVLGYSSSGYGVKGESAGGYGVYGKGATTKGGVVGTTLTTSPTITNFGVYGESDSGYGVWGKTTSGRSGLVGLRGIDAPSNVANTGIYGEGPIGILGKGISSYGVYGLKADDDDNDEYPAVYGKNQEANSGENPGVKGESTSGYGVYGIGNASGKAGVYGSSTSGFGVRAMSTSSYAIHATSDKGGIRGWTTDNYAIHGYKYAGSADEYAAVYGENRRTVVGDNPGVMGESSNGYGVYGLGPTSKSGVVGTTTGNTPSRNNCGVYGETSGGVGVYGQSGATAYIGSGYGVLGVSDKGAAFAAVKAYGVGATPGIWASSVSGRGGYFTGSPAIYTFGDIYADGKITMTAADAGTGGKRVYASDVAEIIETAAEVEPGDVVVISQDENAKVEKSKKENDTTVAGIISTDPRLKMGDINDIKSKNPGKNYGYLALAGQVPCKVDASYGEIKRGDWLTTSPTSGHAMKAADPKIGTILGKALEPFASGKGKILVLVTLQ